MENKPSDIADKTAIVISIICVLHCLFTPLLLVALPVLAGYAIFEGEALHLWLLVLIVPISLLSIVGGYLRHRNQTTIILAGLGILSLISAVTFGHDLFDHLGEIVLTVLGSILIATGHVKNLRLRQSCSV